MVESRILTTAPIWMPAWLRLAIRDLTNIDVIIYDRGASHPCAFNGAPIPPGPKR